MNKSIKIIINYWLGPLLFLLLSWSLYRQIKLQPELPQRWSQVKDSWQDAWFWLVFLLMFINYGIESLKWQWQLAPLEKLSFSKAIRSVMAGSSITMLTPNRIGEYAGRIMYVKEENRIRAIPLTILGSISQLAITMIMGISGLLYLRYGSADIASMADMPWFLNRLILVLGITATLILFLFYFKVHVFIRMMQKVSILKGLVKYVSIADAFSRKQLLRILFLSFLRYMVFILQYGLMMKVMQVELGWVFGSWLLTQFFLVMVLAPTIGFTELPVRATAGVAILSLFSSNILGIQAAIFAIWLINLVIPALIGSMFILGVKLMKVT